MMLAKDPAQRPTMGQVVSTLQGLCPQVVLAPADDDDDDFVVEMTADMEEDEVDFELDRLIAELSPSPAPAPMFTAGRLVQRLALGSNG
jgi:hypothetical protein